MGFTIEKLRFNHWKVEQAGWWRLPRLTINNVDLDINICGKHGEQALFCFAINEDAKLHWRASKINHAWPAPLKKLQQVPLDEQGKHHHADLGDPPRTWRNGSTTTQGAQRQPKETLCSCRPHQIRQQRQQSPWLFAAYSGMGKGPYGLPSGNLT